MIVLHGCNGVSRHAREVAARLAHWGYAALVVDSFRPRGFKNVCNRGRDFPAGRRVADVFAAADYLRRRKDIDPDHVGALGISHGAWTVLYAATASTVVSENARPPQAIVAYYPWCFPHPLPTMTDVQIFIGSADDWTRAPLRQYAGELPEDGAAPPAVENLSRRHPCIRFTGAETGI